MRLSIFSLSALLIVLSQLSLSAADTISGRVTNSLNGAAVANADIDVFDSTGAAVTITDAATGLAAKTNANGDYSVQLPGGGTYRLRVDLTSAAPLADRYYGDTILKSAATPIVVASGTDVTGIDISLVAGYPILGSIQASGVGLANIDLDVYEATTGEFLSSYPGISDVNGNYTLGAFPVGSYIIRANPDPSLGQFYLDQYYGGDSSLVSAVPVNITAAAVTGINFSLLAGGSITGTISSAATTLPLAGIDLDVYDMNGVRLTANATTDATGVYYISNVPAGQYTLRADPTAAQAYARAYYSTTFPNSLFHNQATLVTVTGGTATPNIDFSLLSAGTISGFIYDSTGTVALSGVDLDVYDAALNRTDITARTAADGSYQLAALPVGSYIVRADPTATSTYLYQYYTGQTDPLLATPVVVTAGNDSPGINFNLASSGWVSGTIRDAANNPLANIDIDVFDAVTGVRISGNSITAADGTYLFGPLAPGSYTVRADPTVAQQYAVEYYDSKINKALANAFTVTGGVGTTGVDFTLELGGTIFGQLLFRNDGTPIESIDIDVFDAVTGIRLDQSSKTDVNGNWMVGPLPAGTYIVRADAALATAYGDIYSGNVRAYADATALTVAPGVDQTMPNPLQMPPQLVMPDITFGVGNSNATTLDFVTEVGLYYSIEYKLSLSDPTWTPLETFTGTGAAHSLTTSAASIGATGSAFFHVNVD